MDASTNSQCASTAAQELNDAEKVAVQALQLARSALSLGAHAFKGEAIIAMAAIDTALNAAQKRPAPTAPKTGLDPELERMHLYLKGLEAGRKTECNKCPDRMTDKPRLPQHRIDSIVNRHCLPSRDSALSGKAVAQAVMEDCAEIWGVTLQAAKKGQP